MTPDRWVVDASVIGAALSDEAASDQARRFLSSGPVFLAPDLLRTEIASLLAKKVWRKETSLETGRRAMESLGDIIDEFVSSERLAGPAFALAAQHRFSAYDALYLALAQSRQARVVTLDAKLIERAHGAGFSAMVNPPPV